MELVRGGRGGGVSWARLDARLVVRVGGGGGASSL